MAKFRSIFICFAFGIAVSSVIYSCGSQKTLAGVATSNTLPNTNALGIISIKQDSLKAKPKLSKEQIEFTKKLNYVLDNSGKTFENVSSIASSMNNLSDRMDNLTDVILTRATELRQSNDILKSQAIESYKQQKELLKIALNESKARQANEKKTEEDRKQNVANTKAQSLYTTIGLSALIGLLIAWIIMYLDIRRIRAKVKLVTQYE